MRRGIVGIGASEHARVLLEILASQGAKVVGLVDRDERKWGSAIGGVLVLGDDALLPRMHAEGVTRFFNAVGGVGDTAPRRRVYVAAVAAGLEPVCVIHHRAIVSPSARLGAGTQMMAGAIAGTGAVVGDNTIVNTGAILDHDCSIGAHVHVATGARLSGSVRVEDSAHIGAGATIRQGIRIGRGAVVGAGAVVIKDVEDGVLVLGVPARPRNILSRDYE